MSVNDLQPKPTTITIQGTSYEAKRPSVGVLMVLKKVASIIDKAINTDDDLATEKLLSIDKDLDLIIENCIPELKKTIATLSINEIVVIIEALTISAIPEESIELVEEKVVLEGSDPKVRKT